MALFCSLTACSSEPSEAVIQTAIAATQAAMPTATFTATRRPTNTATPPPSHTPTVQPTYTPRPTFTRRATNTPTPTLTPAATATSQDTATSQAPATPAPTATLEAIAVSGRQAATVSRIIDGDTIEVIIDGQTYSVRYIGMDTPETNASDETLRHYAQLATEANAQLVQGQTVYLERDVSETDRYGRLLRYVYLTSGTMVNAELVRLGFAQAVTYPPDVANQDLFLTLQAEARAAERGLWVTGAGGVAGVRSPQLEPPTETPQPTEAPALAPGNVVIKYIYYDGQVPRVESDEYAVIQNTGGSPVNLTGWRLNAGAPGQDFGFPAVELQPGQECRVYTNEVHPESCGFSFGSGQALWNNKGDCGYLHDSTGAEVASHCY